jgi:tetratricopeptide (TPR) repeat protein
MLPGWDKPDKDVLKLVYDWLCDETNSRWVMIIDNADDVGVFTSSSHLSTDILRNVSGGRTSEGTTPRYLLEFLPQSPNGSILITSRSRDAAFRLAGSYTDIIRVDPMNGERALVLLRNKLRYSFEPDDAAELIEALDYMPLAITQAAAYIGQRAPRITVSKYLQNFRNGERDQAALLSNDMGDSRRDGRSSNSIIATWQISFEHIRRESPSSTQLLSLMSLFDRQGIPESLLVGRYQDDAGAKNDANARPAFETDLSILTNFSMVAIDVDGDQFKMHRLVQFSTRKWLELQGELEIWKEKYVTVMYDSFPSGKFETWKECQALFPHAEAALSYRPLDDATLLKWSKLLYRAAWYADDAENFETATQLLRASLEVDEAILGADNQDTLATASNLGSSLSSLGKIDEAEALLRRTLELQEKVLGPEHPDSITTATSLGSVLSDQEKYDEARVMLQRAFKLSEEVHGPEHLTTLSTIKVLGLTYLQEGKLDEAEGVFRRVAESYSKAVGPEHPHTLESRLGLAFALQPQGKQEVAVELFHSAYNDMVKSFGSDHKFTIEFRELLEAAQWRTK